MADWKLEDNVNDWVKSEFARIKQDKYTVESAMSPYLKNALVEGLKLKRLETEESGGKAWKPDFELECFNIPVIIEDKLGINKLISGKDEEPKNDMKSIQNYAVNGAIHYAQCAVMSKKYTEAVAIGVAGDSSENIMIKVYYVYGATDKTYKLMENYTTLDFLESKTAFNEFYKSAVLTEEEKHKILITSQVKLQEYAKKLNKLMHNHSITAPQRVLYVSGMLLSMQDIIIDGELKKKGLVPENLEGIDLSDQRDGDIIVKHIYNYLKTKNIPEDKVKLMMKSFEEINKDSDRDKKIALDSAVDKILKDDASVNKQIFAYIYENIFLSIDSMSGHLDIMGEMYSEFLKYALGDGKEIGIVLTPPYVTKMMAQILDVDENSKVMDLATGSAGFLISSMELMIENAQNKYGKDTTKAKNKIKEIKENQLLGVELNAEMYTLASTNMILRGDGSSNIKKGSSFDEPPELYKSFNADRLLLNPPFSFKENGLPFLKFGLENMQKGGKAAIIIQDSAGNGQAVSTCKEILKNNQLLASIKMPIDLFVPMAGVQTSVYIVEHTEKQHDFSKQVKFIDFRNDGYKRSKRGINEIDNPVQRYKDIVEIYKNGATANVSPELWDLKKIVIMDVITNSGKDWNFDQHQKIDTTLTLDDFKKTVSDYLAWEVSKLLKNKPLEDERLGK